MALPSPSTGWSPSDPLPPFQDPSVRPAGAPGVADPRTRIPSARPVPPLPPHSRPRGTLGPGRAVFAHPERSLDTRVRRRGFRDIRQPCILALGLAASQHAPDRIRAPAPVGKDWIRRSCADPIARNGLAHRPLITFCHRRLPGIQKFAKRRTTLREFIDYMNM